MSYKRQYSPEPEEDPKPKPVEPLVGADDPPPVLPPDTEPEPEDA